MTGGSCSIFRGCVVLPSWIESSSGGGFGSDVVFRSSFAIFRIKAANCSMWDATEVVGDAVVVVVETVVDVVVLVVHDILSHNSSLDGNAEG